MKKSELIKLLRKVDNDVDIYFIKTFIGEAGKIIAKEFDVDDLIVLRKEKDTVWLKLACIESIDKNDNYYLEVKKHVISAKEDLN